MGIMAQDISLGFPTWKKSRKGRTLADDRSEGNAGMET
jgi:hypothetical protein